MRAFFKVLAPVGSALLTLIQAPVVHGQPAAGSTNDAIPYRTQDQGGGRVRGGLLTMDVSFGSGGGLSTSSDILSQNSYVGQLNEPPIVGTILLKDDFAREINDTTILFVRQNVHFSANFKDPDQPDSQTGTIDWGDGTSSFLGSMTPGQQVNTNHAYTVNKTYLITFTVADAASSRGIGQRTINVIRPVDAITNLVTTLSALLQNPALQKKAAKAIQKAIDDLTAKNDGAVAKLGQGDLVAALTRIGKAIDDLQTAEEESSPRLDLSEAKLILSFAAAAIVADAIANADASKPNNRDGIITAKNLLNFGLFPITTSEFSKAIGQFLLAIAALNSSDTGGESIGGAIRLEMVMAGDKAMRFKIYGSPAEIVELEWSSNLQNWEKVESVNVPLNGIMELEIPRPENNRAGFFRPKSVGGAVR